MKRALLGLIFAWYFGIRIPLSGGISMTTAVGPFKTQADCEKMYNEMVESAKADIPEATFAACSESK